jgi:hypothetical protein
MMTSEPVRIADQMSRAFSGDAWHGPPFRDLLTGITAGQASDRPIPAGHSIWELVLHIDIYTHAALEAISEIPMPHWYGTERDWPPAVDIGERAWTQAKDRLFRNAEQLALAIRELPEDRLLHTVPGRDYNFYHLFHGIVQHSLYHGGQIAILKKASSAG